MNERQNTTLPQSQTDTDQLLEIDLSVLFKAVLLRLPLVIGICGTVIALALVYCFTATPIFQANCRMLVEQGSLKVTQIQDVYDSNMGSGKQALDTFLATQMKLITSDHLLAQVFTHFNFAEKDGFKDARTPLQILEKLVEVKQIPKTNLIDIGFKWPEPTFAAQVANYLAELYMKDSQQRASGFSTRGLEKLQEELLNMENNRRKASERLNAYRTEHDILAVDTAQKLSIERMTKLDEARVNAEEALASAQATVDAIAQWRKEGRRLDSIPEAIQNPTLTQFKVAKLNAQVALVQTLMNFGPAHRDVAFQQRIIRDMDRAIAEETENSLVSAQAKVEQARVRVRIIAEKQEAERQNLIKLDSIADEYNMLAEKLTASEAAYKMVLGRVNELEISRSADSGAGGTFQIIVPATPPQNRVSPQKAKIMVIAALAAGMFSVLLCVVLELLDNTLKRKEDLEAITQVPIFGFVPFAGDGERVETMAYDVPTGTVAESLRALRTSLSLSEAGRKARLLAVTSSVSGEGKTFLSLNTAISYAQAGKRVLVMDADLRRHRVTSLLLPEKEKRTRGLSNLLAEDIPLSQTLSLLHQPFEDLSLYVLPSGPEPPNPSELLGGSLTAPLIHALLEQFDLIIMDVPPVLAVSDARTLAAIPELRFLLVVRMLATEKRQLRTAMESLHTVGARIIGTVMNNANSPASSYGGSGYNNNYGYGYEYGYGYNDQADRNSHMPWWKRLMTRVQHLPSKGKK